MRLLACATAAAVGAAVLAAPANAQWPERPIEISVFAAAGGGTDLINRTIAAAMEPHLGVTINVVNRTGGGGGVALNHVWSAPHDGYSWGGFSESALPAPVMGAHETTAEDWHYFMVAGAPDVVSVRADSPHESLDDLIAAAKAEPGRISAGASIAGSIHHTLLVALERAAEVEFNFLPFDGSHPSQVAAMSGEADIVVTSVQEQSELLRSGDLRPLAMIGMEAYEFEGVGAIPPAGEAYPGVADVPVYQWLGFALPRDVPEDVLDKVTEAFEQAMASPEVQALAERELTLYGYHGEEADRVARDMQAAWTWLLQDLGMAQHSPEEFGIPRP